MIQFPTLSIAGFDNSGGAGLQADLKVFSAFGCYGMSTVTAIAVQNTRGVKSCFEIPLGTILQQLETIFEDIRPKAIKIGMLFNDEIITLITDFLQSNASEIPIVLDPVMIAKSGDLLLLESAIDALKTKLIPLADIITPNIPESLTLLGRSSENYSQEILSKEMISQETIGEKLLSLGSKYVLVKGGHYNGSTSSDLLISPSSDKKYFESKRINTKNTHGTGCTLSAAITANLARGLSMTESVDIAKKYISKAIESSSRQSVGSGAGPTDHFWFLTDACNGKCL
ncbi:MAG: bifunctional hydroxymethylpyrimidine kinase/phosphomethylpyrimidine kinase [Brevinema sp.]